MEHYNSAAKKWQHEQFAQIVQEINSSALELMGRPKMSLMKHLGSQKSINPQGTDSAFLGTIATTANNKEHVECTSEVNHLLCPEKLEELLRKFDENAF